MAKKPKQASPNDSTLSAQTMAALGLSQQPFSNNILSADAIFSHASLTQLKDTIKHHLQFSDLLLIVEGDFGSGKTTFFRQLMQDEVANVFLMPIQAEATDTLTQIQQKMSIHLKEQGDANYLDENLKNLQVFDQTPVLMVDDAHVLSDTTLQEIIRYREQLLSEKQLPLKILLFANKGMAATIEHISELQHSQLFVQEMPTLKAKQIQSFIGHRLAAAGARQPPLIDDKHILVIYKKSAGSPLAVMQQAAAVLEKLGRKSKRSARPLPKLKPGLLLGILAILAGLAVAAYFMLGQEQEIPTTAQPMPVPIAPEPQQPTGTSTQSPGPAPLTEEPASPAIPQAEPALPAPEPQVETTLPGETAPAFEEAPGSPAVANEDMADPTAPAGAVEPAPAAPQEKTTPPSPPPPPVPARPPAPPAAPKPVISPGPARTESRAMDPALQTLDALGVKDRTWLLQQKPGHWTLQILGAREPETLVKFVKRHRLGDQTGWYVTELKGRPWYVLVHRIYTDRDIARQSIQRLPDSLRQARPWVRSLASVQQSIGP